MVDVSCAAQSVEVLIGGASSGLFLSQTNTLVWQYGPVDISGLLDPQQVSLSLEATCADNSKALWPELTVLGEPTPTFTPTLSPTPTSTPTITPTPIGGIPFVHWSFEETDYSGSSQVQDVSGNGFHVDESGLVSDPDGVIGRAGDFSSNGRLSGTSLITSDWELENDFTYLLWLKWTSPAEGGTVTYGGFDGPDSFIDLDWQTTPRLVIYYGVDEPCCKDLGDNIDDISWTQDQWYLLTLVFTNGNEFRVFRDGILLQSITGDTVDFPTYPADIDSVGNRHEGLLDEIRYYKHAFSDDDVLDLYTAEFPGTPTPTSTETPTSTATPTMTPTPIGGIPYVHWAFEEASYSSGEDVLDSSGNGFHVNQNNLNAGETGVSGSAADFTSFGNINHTDFVDSSWQFENDWTILFWLKTTSSPSGGIVNYTSFIDTKGTYLFSWLDTPTFRYDFVSAFPANASISGSISSFSFTQDWWHLMTYVFENGNEIRVYKDGSLMDSTTGDAVDLSDYPKDFSLGFDHEGLLDEYRYYRHAFSDQDIMDLFLDEVALTGQVTDTPTPTPTATSTPTPPGGIPYVHWAFEETSYSSGEDVLDSSGNGFHINQTDLIAGASGVAGSAADFTSDGYLSQSNFITSDWEMDFNWTILFWVKTTTTPDPAYANFTTIEDSTLQDYFLWLTPKMAVSLKNISPSNEIQGTVNDVELPLNQWVFLTYVFQGNNEVRIFKDGALLSSLTGDAIDHTFYPKKFTFGERIPGVVDEYRYYRHALSNQDVLDLYSSEVLLTGQDTPTPVPTATNTPTASPTSTPTSTDTPTATGTASHTNTPTPSVLIESISNCAPVIGGNVRGFEFTVLQPITVDELGVWDQNSDGLFHPTEIGIWNLSQNLLVTGMVSSGTGATLEGEFRYVDVADTLLMPGNYVIGANILAPDQYSSNCSSVNLGTPFHTVQGRWNSGIGFSFPSTMEGGNLYFGPNFKYFQ